jgi:hypothetical protein
MVYITLNERLSAPAEMVSRLNFPEDRGKIPEIIAQYPEVAEIGCFKIGGEYSTIYSDIKDEKTRNAIKEAAPAIMDTTKKFISGFSLYSDSTYILKLHEYAIGERDYVFAYPQKAGENRLVVIDMAKLQPLVPDIIQKSRRHFAQLFEEYFSRYPSGNSVVVKLFDRSGNNFYTFGKPLGYEWKMFKESEKIGLFPWKMSVQIYSSEKSSITLANDYSKYYTRVFKGESSYKRFRELLVDFKVLEFIAGLALILLLVHFSPHLHGFRTNPHTDQSANS